jgi:predicted ATP-binding protein involved in virulence
MVKIRSEIESRIDSRGRAQTSIPSYFLSITLENVRCFGPAQTLDLSDGKGRPAQWTIILGNNDVVKTTLLQSLIAIAPTEDEIDYGDEEGPIQCLTPRLFVDFRLLSDWKPFRHGTAKTTSITATFFRGANLADDKGAEEVREIFIKIPKSHTWWSNAGSANSRLGDSLVCFGYGASRRMGETSLSDKTEDDPYASLFSDNVALLNAEEWLLQADYAAHAAKSASAKRQAEKRRDKIREVLISKNFLPDIDDIKFTQLTENQLKPGIEVKTPYGWVSLKDLSLGYRTLIAWMVDLASRLFDRYPDSTYPLHEPAVVLVDEIDLHLHPKWQRNLMGFLTNLFPNTQFIATAHSPLVVQAATDANVVLLRREGDHVVIDNDVKAIHNWRVDQILTSDLFGLESARPPELDKLLAERTEILSKAKLTKKDRARLKRIEEEIGSMPTGETPEDMEAMDVIRRAAEKLKAEGY